MRETREHEGELSVRESQARERRERKLSMRGREHEEEGAKHERELSMRESYA